LDTPPEEGALEGRKERNMRALKLCVVLGLVLAVSGTAGAVTFNQAYDGPIMWDIQDYDSGTYWQPLLGTLPGRYDLQNPVDRAKFTRIPGMGSKLIDPDGIPANGDEYQEDTWGVFRINSIFKGKVGIANQTIIPGDDPLPLWSTNSDGMELVGIFYGGEDLEIEVLSGGSQIIWARNIVIDVWEQPYGSYMAAGETAPGAADGGHNQGSGGRLVAPDAYNGIGTPGLVAGATHWLQVAGQPGFVGDVITPGFYPFQAEVRSSFDPGATVGADAGDALIFGQVTGGAIGQPFPPNIPSLDSDWYQSQSFPGTTADIRIKFDTLGNNTLNQATNVWGTFDWTVTSSDETAGIWIVPEPATMLCIGSAVVGLLGYIRRRRLA